MTPAFDGDWAYKASKKLLLSKAFSVCAISDDDIKAVAVELRMAELRGWNNAMDKAEKVTGKSLDGYRME